MLMTLQTLALSAQLTSTAVIVHILTPPILLSALPVPMDTSSKVQPQLAHPLVIRRSMPTRVIILVYLVILHVSVVLVLTIQPALPVQEVSSLSKI